MQKDIDIVIMCKLYAFRYYKRNIVTHALQVVGSVVVIVFMDRGTCGNYVFSVLFAIL